MFFDVLLMSSAESFVQSHLTVFALPKRAATRSGVMSKGLPILSG